MTNKKQPNVNQLEEYLRSLIKEELEKRETGIKENDAKQIISSMVQEIDIVTSKRIKQHFKEIADFILDKFSEEK